MTVLLKLDDKRERYCSGICSQIGEVGRDVSFTHYRLEMVPQLWLLTRQAQSRIFQNMSVPDILKKVLTGLDVTWEIQGTFQPRDYCVQYRETDFNFASRLMEEEGIYYFFKHGEDEHKMVVANTPTSHPDLPLESRIIFDETVRDRLARRCGSGAGRRTSSCAPERYTLWDHSFELPHKHLEGGKHDPGHRGRGQGGPQAEGREQRASSSSTTFPASTPSASTAWTAAAATGRRICRRSSRTTRAPRRSGCRRRRRAA